MRVADRFSGVLGDGRGHPDGGAVRVPAVLAWDGADTGCEMHVDAGADGRPYAQFICPDGTSSRSPVSEWLAALTDERGRPVTRYRFWVLSSYADEAGLDYEWEAADVRFVHEFLLVHVAG